MRITADTNLLLRTLLQDDASQAALADASLAMASLVVIPPMVLYEFAWVLRRGYGYANDEIAHAINAICDLDVVVTDKGAVDAGPSVLHAGGDFADGVIAHQGCNLGGRRCASFDREAVPVLRDGGITADDPARLVSD